MKIFNLIVMKKVDYDYLVKAYKDGIYENNEFINKLKRLEQKHKDDIRKFIESEHDLEDRIYELEEQKKLNEKFINSLKKSNVGYKSNNSRLKREKEELKRELANSYKRVELPPDRTKSKQISKVKSSSKLSSLAKSMNK